MTTAGRAAPPSWAPTGSGDELGGMLSTTVTLHPKEDLRSVQQFASTLVWESEDAGTHEVAFANGFLANLSWDAMAIIDDLDSISADALDLGLALQAVTDTDGHEIPLDDDEVWPEVAILIDHVTVPVGLRGNGLGPAIVADTIKILSFARDAAVSVLVPQPDGWQEMGGRELAQCRAKVKSAWAKVGFQPIGHESGALAAHLADVPVMEEYRQFLADPWR